MTERAGEKRAVRPVAVARRAAAHAAAPGAARRVAAHALDVLSTLRDIEVVSGYLPVRRELDPLPAMMALFGLGYRVAVPVIEGSGQPLGFREWRPRVRTVPGAFGVAVPAEGATLEPDLLLVPMLAFDRRGHRLGYGGGFYDRTIAGLRARRQVTALGVAFAAQEMPEVPDSAHDMRLDAVLTEDEVIRPA